MQIDKSPFLKLDHATVLGHLKAAGSRDPDVLHSTKAGLISAGKFPKLAGIYLMILGGIMTVTILLSPLGIPALIAGWWMWRRGAGNLAAIEEAYAEFVGGVPSEPGASVESARV